MSNKKMSVSESSHNSDIVSNQPKTCHFCSHFDFFETLTLCEPYCTLKERLIKNSSQAEKCKCFEKAVGFNAEKLKGFFPKEYATPVDVSIMKNPDIDPLPTFAARKILPTRVNVDWSGFDDFMLIDGFSREESSKLIDYYSTPQL